MSERWGICTSCKGTGRNQEDVDNCICGGTGFDGSIEAYESYQKKGSKPVIKSTHAYVLEEAVKATCLYLSKKHRQGKIT